MVFDRSASGYASSVADRLPQILRAAAGELNCSESCDSACQHCLLDFDTRFRLDDLDRHAGQGFLSGEWLTALALPAELAHFGPSSVAEHQTLVEAITRELAMPSCEVLRIFLGGEPEGWDLAVSPLHRWASRWAATGVAVELVLRAGLFSMYRGRSIGSGGDGYAGRGHAQGRKGGFHRGRLCCSG